MLPKSLAQESLQMKKVTEKRSFFQFSAKFNRAQVLFVFINGSLQMRLEIGNAYEYS